MDDASLSGLLVVLLLILIHAMITMAHAAIINARVRDLAEDGDRRAKQVVAMSVSTNFTVTFYLLIALLRFAIAGITVISVTQPLVEGSTGFSNTGIYILVLFLMACITLILGDIVPEAVGSTYANPMALAFAGPMRSLVRLCSPIVFVLLKVSRALSSIFKSGNLVNRITEEEIMTLVDAGHTGGTIEEEEKDMIYSVLQLDQTRVSEVMVPRIDIVAVELNQSLDEAADVFVRSGYSRIPVYDENIDNIKGLLYAKDLLARWKDDGDAEEERIEDLMRPAYYVPETKRADELLKEIQSQKVHIAIVVDEYGGTAGLVTIENIIEEIIGDIQDEYDVNEEAEYEQSGPDEYTVDASIDLDDFNDLLDVDLPTEDSDTLGGYIYTYFGRVPVIGETIENDDLLMQVMSVDGRRIRKVHVLRKHRTDESEFSEASSNSADEQEQVTRAG